MSHCWASNVLRRSVSATVVWTVASVEPGLMSSPMFRVASSPKFLKR